MDFVKSEANVKKTIWLPRVAALIWLAMTLLSFIQGPSIQPPGALGVGLMLVTFGIHRFALQNYLNMIQSATLQTISTQVLSMPVLIKAELAVGGLVNMPPEDEIIVSKIRETILFSSKKMTEGVSVFGAQASAVERRIRREGCLEVVLIALATIQSAYGDQLVNLLKPVV